MTTSKVYFDDALPAFADAIAKELGDTALSEGVVLRDASGRLAFFAHGAVGAEALRLLATRLVDAVGVYARADRVVADQGDPAGAVIFADPTKLRIKVGKHVVNLVDRRIAGADWLRAPTPSVPPRRFVFASMKGGVGRSTALVVAAAHLAEDGKRVLAVDLDLEAPGLGPFLLPDAELPRFGVLDALVENGLRSLDADFLTDLVASSPIANRGRIDVLPAFGRRSVDEPAEVLAKLARAYAEDIRPDGTVATIRDQIAELVQRFAQPDRYDVVLIDARAGLHETIAASMLGLGAEVLLFGRDERQTFQGYAAILGQLGRLIPEGDAIPEWVERLTAVHALAPVDPQARAGYAARWKQLVRAHGPLALQQKTALVQEPDGVSKVAWDESVSDEEIVREVMEEERSLLRPIAVLRDSNYESFDPLARGDQISRELRDVTFGQLIEYVQASLDDVLGG